MTKIFNLVNSTNYFLFQDFNPRAAAATTSEDDDDFQFNPRASSVNNGIKNNQQPAAFVASPPPALPPRDVNKTPVSINNNNNVGNLYPELSSPPVNPFVNNGDLFGMGSFNSAPVAKQNGFSASFTKPNFSLDELDPLKN